MSLEALRRGLSAALPDRAVRDAVRDRLRAYRHRSGQGGRAIAKEAQRLLGVHDIDDAKEIVETNQLARRIDYWTIENGDLKNAPTYFFLKEFVERIETPHVGLVKQSVLDLGRQFATFLAGDRTKAGARGTPKSMPRPGFYSLTQHDNDAPDAMPKTSLTLVDVGESFLLAHFLVAKWQRRTGDFALSLSQAGFLFLNATPSRLLLRNPQTLETRIWSARSLDRTIFSTTVPGLKGQSEWCIGVGEDPDRTAWQPAYFCWNLTPSSDAMQRLSDLARLRVWELGLVVVPATRSLNRLMAAREDVSSLEQAVAIASDGGPLSKPKRLGITKLHRAAWLGDLHGVEQALEVGESPIEPDGIGRTPIDLAVTSGFPEVEERLRLAAERHG